MTKTIITHTAPDFDAIAGTWLTKRFAPGFADALIKFMPLNAIDRRALDAADAVIDMGGAWDEERGRFDHHHLRGAYSTAICAATQVWTHLSAGQDLEYLRPLIKEIHMGDLAQTPAVGIHSLMLGWKVSTKEIGITLSDFEIYSYGRDILDRIATWLEKKAADRMELEECVVWKSQDELVWATSGGATGSSFAAFEQGARVVVFEGKPIELADGTTTYPVGASRAPEWQEPDLGELTHRIQRSSTDMHLLNEVSRWFRHEAGFFTGRGTRKAPDDRFLTASIVEIAKAIHLAWER